MFTGTRARTDRRRNFWSSFCRKIQDGWTRILPVLSVIKQTEHSRLRLGRKTVLKELEDRGLFFSEQEIRTLFQTLAFYRLIRITRGRGGTCITGLGIKAYNLMMEKGAAQTESPQ